jgi:hypothetical protein
VENTVTVRERDASCASMCAPIPADSDAARLRSPTGVIFLPIGCARRFSCRAQGSRPLHMRVMRAHSQTARAARSNESSASRRARRRRAVRLTPSLRSRRGISADSDGLAISSVPLAHELARPHILRGENGRSRHAQTVSDPPSSTTGACVPLSWRSSQRRRQEGGRRESRRFSRAASRVQAAASFARHHEAPARDAEPSSESTRSARPFCVSRGQAATRCTARTILDPDESRSSHRGGRSEARAFARDARPRCTPRASLERAHRAARFGFCGQVSRARASHPARGSARSAIRPPQSPASCGRTRPGGLGPIVERALFRRLHSWPANAPRSRSPGSGAFDVAAAGGLASSRLAGG